MRFGVLGVIDSDWTDVTHESVAVARELGFTGIGAHLRVPASTITDDVAENVRACISEVPAGGLAKRNLTVRAAALGLDVH